MDVRLEDLAVSFGTVDALAGVSLGLRQGEVSVFAGPNGAGKSTLLGVLLGLVRPTRGRVLANGQLVADPGRLATASFRAQVGYMPEAVAFSENLTGRQVLRFFARARGVDKARVSDVLRRVGLYEASNRRVGGYSRGMKQRLGLGVAILHAPEILVLDEPTGGLDQEGLGVLWGVLREWRDAGRVVVMSSHELALVERRASRMFVLNGGRLVASGTPDELRKRSGLQETVRLGPGLDEVYEALIGGPAWDASVAH